VQKSSAHRECNEYKHAKHHEQEGAGHREDLYSGGFGRQARSSLTPQALGISSAPSASPPPMTQPGLSLRHQVLGLLADQTRALHAREVAQRLSVREGDYLALLQLLNELTFEGAIRGMPGQRFRAGRGHNAEIREGVLSLHPRGFGFVSTPSQSEDVYIPPSSLAGAMHRDRVRVAILTRSRRGLEGRIEQVLERANLRVAGLLRRRGRSAWLEPDDVRVRGPIVLPSGVDALDGAAAVVQITRYPQLSDENPEGVILACLGEPGNPTVELRKVLLREGLEDDFAPEAIEQAAAFGSNIDRVAAAGREDLREIPFVTIDPDDARDHDDAIWVSKSASGFELWVAIADVAQYVQASTPLDEAARARAFSVYLPDRAIPMLPPALSSNLCSLVAEQDRLCLAVHVRVDRAGRARSTRIVEAVMRSRAKLAYGELAAQMRWTQLRSGATLPEDVRASIDAADQLARVLRKRRVRRGSLELQIPEPQVLLDPVSAEPVDVCRRAADPGVRRSYQLIEELMVVTNEAVAQWLIARSCSSVFRVHPPPDETKLRRLGALCELLHIEFDVDDASDPKRLAALLSRVADHPAAEVIGILTLRSLKQARYDVVNAGHFGLALGAYLHFTSPIRRYPDLLVHRVVKNTLRADATSPQPPGSDGLPDAVAHCNLRERRIMEVEREIVDLYRALLMRSRLATICEGMVVEVVSGGVFVALDDPFVEVRVTDELLGRAHYELSEDGLRVVAERTGDVVALGDRMRIRVEAVNLERRCVLASRWGGQQGVRGEKGGARRGRSKGGRRSNTSKSITKTR
jgi:ribonuclease R